MYIQSEWENLSKPIEHVAPTPAATATVARLATEFCKAVLNAGGESHFNDLDFREFDSTVSSFYNVLNEVWLNSHV